jgi:DNA-binding winged helix-turn-helix (wHTH) protein
LCQYLLAWCLQVGRYERLAAMTPTIFNDVRFGADFLTAVRADGTALRFTRQERALLGQLAAHPGRLFTRDELFAALGSQGSDRNVDFVINPLRGKLQDTGPQRRFISTQYGEGYVWVATPTEPADDAPTFFIGPVRGPRGDQLDLILRGLQSALQNRLGAGLAVRLAPDLAPGATGGHALSLELDAHPAAGRLHAAFVLRHAAFGAPAATFRESFAGPPTQAALDAIADRIAEAAWSSLALVSPVDPTPTDPPLHLRLVAASVLLDPPGEAWTTNADQIARLRARTPGDPRADMLWAMHLFTRFTVDPGVDLLGPSNIDALSDEIEQLVLRSLPAVRDDPVMALAAAKLLLGVHRGHEDLAQSLADTAFAGSAAFAAAFPMLGQIAACRGDLAEADRLYDEGLRLCEPGSAFEVYIQVLKAMTLVAQDDRPGVEAVYDRLQAITPTALPRFCLLFLPVGDEGLARRLTPLADRITEPVARRTIAYLHYRVSRYFRGRDHAANILRGPLTHMVQRFGPGVASDAIWREIPAELQYLNRPRTALICPTLTSR